MPEFSPRIWRTLGGFGATQIGAGFVYSYLFVYVAQARGLGAAVAGAVLAAVAGAGALALPLAGWLGDRYGPGRVTVAALLLGSAGSVALALARTPPAAFAGAIVWGAGFAAAWNGVVAIWGSVPPTQRSAVFGTNNVTQNVGWGTGALAGALFAHLGAPGSFAPGFLGDAVLRAGFAALILAAGEPAVTRRGGPRSARPSRPLLAITALSTLVQAAAFSQTTAAFPAWATSVTGSAAIVGLATGAGCLVIATAQMPVLRLALAVAGSRRRLSVVAAGTGLFAVAWLVSLLARPLALVGAMMVFGLGETLYTPLVLTAVNDMAPEGARARYNAVFNLSYQIGPVIGPAVAGAVLAAGQGAALFGGLAAACALAGGAAIAIQPLLAPAGSAAGGPPPT